MFDVLSVVSLAHGHQRPQPTGKAFLEEPWSKAEGILRRSVQGEYFEAVYVEREGEEDAYYSDEGKHVFIVGEAWSSAVGRRRTGLRPGRVSAQEVFSRSEPLDSRFAECLKGNFALVVVDEHAHTCLLLNSRFGISPFYYALTGSLFTFSTSIAAMLACSLVQVELDPVAVAETALFNYPLGERTLVRDIKGLLPAEMVRVDSHGLRRETYWDVRTLYDAPLYSKQDALELGSELLHRTVNDLVSDQSKVRLSFTSGFDSRAVLAVLEKDPGDLLGYAFGIPGSLNISIPEKLCAEIGMPFEPVYLDNGYEDVFDRYALQAIKLSDCLSTVERANYPYAFERLRSFSPVVVTGLFGSELLRTFQNVGHIVSANLVRLNQSSDVRRGLRAIIDETAVDSYFDPALLRQSEEEIGESLHDLFVGQFGEFSSDQQFYLFLLHDGLRKYFGAEVHMERLYGTNRFPFLDDEFVGFMFGAPFAGVHSKTLQPTVSNRFNSQYFYAYVIRKYQPRLLAAPTDHGYPPGDILSACALLKVGPKALRSRWKRSRGHYQEFKTEEWTERFYSRRLLEKGCERHLFSHRLEDDFHSGAWKARRLEFAAAASLRVWLETLETKVGA